MTRLKRLRPQRLNGQQQQFVTLVLSGLTPAEAAQAAGYAAGEGHTYDAAKAASTLLGKPHVAAAVAQGALTKAKENGALSEGWLKDRLVEGIARPMKSSQVQCLLMACRTLPGFFKDREAGDMTLNINIMNLAERLAAGHRRLQESRAQRGLPPIAAGPGIQGQADGGGAAEGDSEPLEGAVDE